MKRGKSKNGLLRSARNDGGGLSLRVNKPFKVFGDENKLIWTDLRRDFSDPKHYAGEGNIAHMLEHIKMHSAELLGKVIK